MISRILFLLGLSLTMLIAQTGLVINEVVSSNITGIPDEYEVDLQNCPVPDCPRWYQDLGESVFDGEYPDWVELFNGGDAPIDLEGYFLSDNETNLTKWTFPALTIPPNEYLFVFASGKDKQEIYVHTNFKLSRGGETVTLSDPQETIVDRVEISELPVDYAFARDPADSSQWIIVDSPTPGQPNQGEAFSGFSDVVLADPVAGFYPRLPNITLSKSDADAEIRYTTNGSMPTKDSSLYNRPIASLFGGDRVIKAQVFKDGRPISPVLTASYLTERTFTMPVISLTTAPEHLWDDELGLYTPGNNAREGDRVANYWNDWERPVHVEFFEPDGTLGFTADAGLRIFGWGSRSNPQKSFAVMFRDRYGVPELEYPLFPNEDLNTFTSFVLRAAGSDSRSNGTFFRDPFASGLLKGRNLDMQAFRPAVVYLNGEYWGIQNIREKMNEDYLASHHPVDADEVDIISRYWRRRHPVVIEGDSDRFLAFEAFLEDNDLSQPDVYEEVLRFMDMDNFLEYTAAQIYLANFDWPGNNNKNWMPRKADGRWRWLMYDLDFTLGFNGNSNFSFNTLDHALEAGGTGWPNPSWTTLILRRLVENEQFRHAFASRMADLANTHLHPANSVPLLDAMQAKFAPEMEFHIKRWAREGDSIGSLSVWERNIRTVRTFLESRGPVILNHVRDTFQLGDLTELRLVLNPDQGEVRVNSVTVNESSWSGTYFEGVPITLTALPSPGWRFLHWQGVPNTPTESTIIVDDPSTTLEPIFEATPGLLNTIMFHEINYRSSPEHDAGDWVELYNGYAQARDLSGWIFRDRQSANRFTLPAGTVIEAGDYLVLCQDKQAFQSQHPNIPCIGDFPFGLSQEAERLVLLDIENRIIDDLTYNQGAGWPQQANGLGATLALQLPNSDNGMASSWGIQPNQGTPSAPNQTVDNPEQEPARLTIQRDGPTIIQLNWIGDGVLERSTNLLDWESLETTAPANVTPDGTSVFYRLRQNSQ